MTAIAKRIKLDDDRAKIVDHVTARFVATGDDSTIKEIAAALGWPESRVRRVIDADHGAVAGLGSWTVSRVSHSRDYPMFGAGRHTVRVYGPSRIELAARLRASDFAAAKLSSYYDALLKEKASNQ